MTPRAFDRYLGIHYSGAETPDSGLKNLRVYSATPDTSPQEVLPPPCPRKYWSRRELAHWLAQELAGDMPTIVGIDHALSFPLRYFEVHGLPPDWTVFLEDFRRHWPTDAPHTYVDFILNGSCGEGATRMGNPRWMRLTDQRCRAARSVFQFEGQGKVAAATHAGLPWIMFLKRQLGGRLHVWPFDGWGIPVGKSALVEVRPIVWRNLVPVAALNAGQKDAFVTASWLKGADSSGELIDLFSRRCRSRSGYFAGLRDGYLTLSAGNEG